MKRGEPFYMPVPRDLKKVKTKIVLNLTKRQLICIFIAGLIGLPVYWLTLMTLGVNRAIFALVICVVPFFISTQYDKNGMPIEVYFKHIYRTLFKYPKKRPYKTNNYYTTYIRQIQFYEEVENIVFSRKRKKKIKHSQKNKSQRTKKGSGTR